MSGPRISLGMSAGVTVGNIEIAAYPLWIQLRGITTSSPPPLEISIDEWPQVSAAVERAVAAVKAMQRAGGES